MIGIAVGQVGLVAHGDLSADLIPHVIIAAHGGALYMNVGIELVELGDVSVEHLLQAGALLRVEGDGHFAAIIAFGGHFKASGEGCGAQHHQNQHNGEKLFHLGFPSFS